jgi:hypothetical protein
LEGGAEVVGDGGEAGDGEWVAGFPLGFHVIDGGIGLQFGDGEESEVGVCGGVDGGLGVFGAGEGPFHVGLAAADPDFADEDVGEGDGLGAAADDEVVGAAGGFAGQADDPAAVGGGGAGLVAAEFDGDGFVGIGRAPDGDGAALLQDGVVAEDGGGSDLGVEAGG